jgi:acyl carrier protein
MDLQSDAWGGLMQDLEQYISDWIKTRFDVELGISENFFEAGALDSLSFAELVVVLEELLQLEIDFDNILDWQTVSTIEGLSTHLRFTTKPLT